MLADTLDLEEIRHWLRRSNKDFARMLGISVTTLWRWQQNGVPYGPGLKLLEKLRDEMRKERAQ